MRSDSTASPRDWKEANSPKTVIAITTNKTIQTIHARDLCCSSLICGASFRFNPEAAWAHRQMIGQPVDLVLSALAGWKHLGCS